VHAVATPWHTGGVDMDIGRFALVNQVSGGRYGAIWKAHDPDHGRDVALKQLALAGPQQHPGIIAEADAAEHLRHPNIVETYPPATDERTIWLVEEWIEGASLAVLSPPHAQLSVPQNSACCAAPSRAWRTRTGTVSCTAACRREPS
jgi:serine/threonine protein kinase